MGLLIPVFAGTVIYGAKTIADSTTRKIVAAERESRTADRCNNWRNDRALKNTTDILAAGLDRVQD